METENSNAGPPLAGSPGTPAGATCLWHYPWASSCTAPTAHDSKEARRVEGDPQEEEGTGGAPPTGPPEMVTTGPFRNKS